MATERPRFTISLSDDLLEKVETYKEQNHFSVRSKAVEALIAAGVDSLIEKGIIPNVHNPPPSRESLEIAAAYDRADEKSRKMARIALEDFMETPVPAMAKRRTERAASDDSPGMDTWRIRDTYWRETLSQWLKEHPDATISSGDVPEWVKFNLLRAVNLEGLPGWTREELRERAERLFERPRTEQPTVIFSPEIDAEAERRRRGKSAQGFVESGVGKTECPSCAQCPLAGRCSQRFSERPFPELRGSNMNMYVIYADNSADYRKLPPAVLSDDQCPLYSVLKAILPEGTLENHQILLNENGTALLPAGNIDLPTILGMINPAIQGALSKALTPSGNNGDDSEKT